MSYHQKRLMKELQDATQLDAKAAKKALIRAHWNLQEALDNILGKDVDSEEEDITLTSLLTGKRSSDQERGSSAESGAREREGEESRAERKRREREERKVRAMKESAPWWERDTAIAGREVSIGSLLKLLVWSVGLVLFIWMEFVEVYVILSALCWIYRSLGKREEGTKSAYSVFNENCESITGAYESKPMDNRALLFQ